MIVLPSLTRVVRLAVLYMIMLVALEMPQVVHSQEAGPGVLIMKLSRNEMQGVSISGGSGDDLSIWGRTTNMFLHSDAPVTQKITLPAGVYTLQVAGQGHAYTALSGVPDPDNHGDGTSTVVTPLIGARDGAYLATFNDGAHYTVTRPDGVVVAGGTARGIHSPQSLAPNFADEILFAIVGGPKAFVQGDKFYFDAKAGCGAGPRMPCTFTLTHKQTVEIRVRGTPSRLWLEPSAIPGPYIASKDKPALRAPDIATFPLRGSSRHGTLIARFRVDTLPNGAPDRTIVQADDGSDRNAIRFRIDEGTATPHVEVVVGGTLIASIRTGPIYADTSYVLGASWTASKITVAMNGVLYGTGTLLSSIPSSTILRLGTDAEGLQPLDGDLVRFVVSPSNVDDTTLSRDTMNRSVVMPKSDHGCAWNDKTDDAVCLQESLFDSAAHDLPLIWPCGAAYVNPIKPFKLPEDVVAFKDYSCGTRPRLRFGPALDASASAFIGQAGTGGHLYMSGITFDGATATFAPDYLTNPVSGAAVTAPNTDFTRNPAYASTRSLITLSGFSNPVFYDVELRNWGSFGFVFLGVDSPMLGHVELYNVGHYATPSSAVLLGSLGFSRPIADVVPGSPCIINVATKLPAYFKPGALVNVLGLRDQGNVVPDGEYHIEYVSGTQRKPALAISYDCSDKTFSFNGHGVIASQEYIPTTNALVSNLDSTHGVHDPIQVSAHTGSVVYSTRNMGGGGFIYGNGAIDFTTAFCDVIDSALVGSVVNVFDCDFSADCQLLSSRAQHETFQGVGSDGGYNQIVDGNYLADAGGAVIYPHNPFNERYGGVIIGRADGITKEFAFKLESVPPPGSLVITLEAHSTDGKLRAEASGDAKLVKSQFNYATRAGLAFFDQPPVVGDDLVAYFPGAVGISIAGQPVRQFLNSVALFETGRSFASKVIFRNNTLTDSRTPALADFGVVTARAGEKGLFEFLQVTGNDFSGLHITRPERLPWSANDPGARPRTLVVHDNLLPTEP
jgi:hypothetical protein